MSTRNLNYQETIFILTNLVKQLQYSTKKLQLNHFSLLINNALQRLETNRFSVVVVGEFNRGKSTFINALCGEDILPSDILPCSATLNRISYGEKPSAKICFHDGYEKEINFHQLANFITKKNMESEAVATTVKEAIVYYPVSYFKHNNLEIIDTPGLSDDDNMTAITLSVLQQCELAIMLISAQSPFSISEQNLLTNKLLDNGVGQVLFVVNEIDRCHKIEDIERIINQVKKRIKATINEWQENQSNPELMLKKHDHLRVWGISAQQALDGKKNQNMALLGKSRFVNFEHDLKTILSEERSLIILEVTVNQILIVATAIMGKLEQEKINFIQRDPILQQTQELINNQISKLQTEKRKVINQIREIITNIDKQIQSTIYHLEQNLQQQADQVIENTTVTTETFKNTNFLTDLSSNISNSLNQTHDNLIKQIYQEINKQKELIKYHIQQLTNSANTTVKTIVNELQQVNFNLPISKQIYEHLHLININSEKLIFINKDQLNLTSFKGDDFLINNKPTGNATGIGAGMGWFLLGPIGAGIGAGIGAYLGQQSRVKKFKELYQPFVKEIIINQFKNNKTEQKIKSYFTEKFSQIEPNLIVLIEEVNCLIDSLQENLSQPIVKRREIIKIKLTELSKIQTETEHILNYTHKMSQILREIRNP